MSGERDEYTRSPERQAIIDALLADRRRRIDQLCERLGIVTFRGYSEKWALVGWELAQKEPEFGPGRGRPKLADPTKGIDAQRAAFVIDVAKELAQDAKMPRLSLARWISEIIKWGDDGEVAGKGGHLFGTITEKAFRRSVKKGMNHHDVPEGLFAKK